MDLENKVFVMNNSNEYMVIEHVLFEGRSFAYLQNINSDIDVMFREVIFKDGLKLVQIDPDLFKKNIYPLFEKKITQE